MATDGVNGAEARLLEGALTVFSEKGYEGASVREIIEEAGVTRPVLYYYFKNKEDLFRQLVRKYLAEMVKEMDTVLERVEGCRACLETLICTAFERAEQNLDVVRLLVHVIFFPPGQGPDMTNEPLLEERFVRLVRVMQDGLDSGELAGGDPEALALAFNAFMDFHAMAKSRFPAITLTADLGKALVDLFMYGASSGTVERLPLLKPYEDDLHSQFHGAE
ncbi:MAG: TetR/AcrR family transcriptional regulator [Candidatus Hydrogenedentota bacterium]